MLNISALAGPGQPAPGGGASGQHPLAEEQGPSSPTQDQPHQAWDPSRFGGAFSDNTFHSLTGVPIPPPLPDLLSGNVMNLQAGATHSAGRVAGDKAVDDMTKVIYICTNAHNPELGFS